MKMVARTKHRFRTGGACAVANTGSPSESSPVRSTGNPQRQGCFLMAPARGRDTSLMKILGGTGYRA